MKGPVDGWVLVRNQDQKSMFAHWVPLRVLPEVALMEVKTDTVHDMDHVKFPAVHNFEDRCKEGDELQVY